MPRLVPTSTLLQFAAVLAALASVLGLLAVDRPAARPGGTATSIERIKSLVSVQVESIASRR